MESVFKGAAVEAPRSKRSRKVQLLPYEQQEIQARKAKMAEYRKEQDRVERKQRLAFLAGLWPFWAGCVLAVFAPEVKEFLAPFNPWVMRVVFPLVAVGARPEIKVGSSISGLLPGLLLIAQFPLEGLLARSLVRKRAAVGPILAQIAFIHCLGVAYVVLIYGGITRFGSL